MPAKQSFFDSENFQKPLVILFWFFIFEKPELEACLSIKSKNHPHNTN
jgi:hypothetical protein